MDALPAVSLEQVAEWVPPGPEKVLLHVGAGPAGELIALWCAEGDCEAFRGGRSPWREGALPESAARASLTITRHEPDGGWSVMATVRGLPVPYPMVQPMLNGSVLVAGAVCELRDTGPDRNAYVLNNRGQVELEATIGDGIQMLQATASGDVWVGFADTGIYGNHGWGDLPEEQPLAPVGGSGFVRFDRDLVKRWEFDATDLEKPDRAMWPITNVYAMNVTDDVAWIYYYTDWAIARVENGRIQFWETGPEGGATAMLVDGEEVALIGGYPPEHDLIRKGTLGAGAMENLKELRLVLADGTPVPPQAAKTARGSALHVITSDARYKLDLKSIR